jgi:hypothetical protein
MRIFSMVDFRHLLLALLLGCIAAVVIYVAFRHHSRPVPTVLIFFFAGFVIWAICYLIFFGFLGGAI